MPRDNTSSTNRCPRLFTGYAIMIMGMMNLFTSDPGDVNNNLGTMLLPFGLLVESEYEQLRRTERRLSSRHGRRGPYKTARTNEFIDNILDNGSEQYSRVGFIPSVEALHFTSVDRSSFFRLLEIIQDDPVFASSGRKPQESPKYQLAAYLMRHRTITGRDVSKALGIAEGSVYNHYHRVAQVFDNLGPLDLAKLTPEERKVTKRFVEDPDAVDV